jgi:hypothetical protein
MIKRIGPILLLLAFACTSDVILFYRIDERYFNLIPQYQNGRAYFSDNGDTITFTLVSYDDLWVVLGVNPLNGKEISVQDRRYYYQQQNGTLDFRFTLTTYPNFATNSAAVTLLEGGTPGGLIRLECLATDTLFFPPMQYAKELMLNNRIYDEVYFDPDRYYYSANGEIIRFKLNNTDWYTLITD